MMTKLRLFKAIHKAGQHMEDHIIAAHCALVIGYMILNDNYINMKEMIDVDAIKSKMKDNSFQFMIKVIRKFIVFMKIMVN
jgi:hypothetical protein